jgi:hypothetical protein
MVEIEKTMHFLSRLHSLLAPANKGNATSFHKERGKGGSHAMFLSGECVCVGGGGGGGVQRQQNSVVLITSSCSLNYGVGIQCRVGG